jgi:hypothetical protein
VPFRGRGLQRTRGAAGSLSITKVVSPEGAWPCRANVSRMVVLTAPVPQHPLMARTAAVVNTQPDEPTGMLDLSATN